MSEEAVPAELYIAPFEATSRALKALIRRDALNQENHGDQIEIRFDVPDQDFINSLPEFPVVNVYLTSFSENTTRRQSEPFQLKSTDKPAGRGTIVRRPKYIDLFYMVSVWSRSQEERALTEQYLLSRLLQSLGKHEVVPEELMIAENYLYGVTMLQMLSDDDRRSQGEFWNALGSAPRPALNLQLTVPVPVHEPEDTPIVLDINRHLRDYDTLMHDETPPTPQTKALAGQVALNGLDYQNFSVQAVRTSDLSIEQRTLNPIGLYAFNVLEPGEYMIRLMNNTTGSAIQTGYATVQRNSEGEFETQEVDFSTL
ncbi:DUF4255 domain-containing protein [Endozoicomonas lisbonensis]|uniref:Pvc16 N-terminal domain-containing protein n=1 Tax=Endozoicomonas lisbonensis TaxID=3120522 RepID=A0ABV2SCS2_9GAMM